VGRALPVLAAAVLLAACSNPFEPPKFPQRQIVSGGAWACRDRATVVDLLFLGNSGSFSNKLTFDVASGTCVVLAGGEAVLEMAKDPMGLIRVQRTESSKMAYWTQGQNLR
jgi:hypothetical protein